MPFYFFCHSVVATFQALGRRVTPREMKSKSTQATPKRTIRHRLLILKSVPTLLQHFFRNLKINKPYPIFFLQRLSLRLSLLFLLFQLRTWRDHLTHLLWPYPPTPSNFTLALSSSASLILLTLITQPYNLDPLSPISLRPLRHLIEVIRVQSVSLL